MFTVRSCVIVTCAVLSANVCPWTEGTPACAFSPAVLQDQSARVELPDTKAAACARAFIEMLNNPAPDVVAAFETKWASEQRRALRSIEQRIAGLGEMKAQHGSYTIEEVITSDENFIILGVSDAGGEFMQMEFQFSGKEQGKLDGVQIMIGGSGARPQPITPAQRDDLIAGTLKALREGYVYPELAETMAKAVEDKLAKGEYDAIKDDVRLARQLTDDLRAVSKDGHLGVRLAPVPPPSSEDQDEMGPTIDMMRGENYGFRKAELLPGNIGYLRFDFFADEQEAREIASGAFAFMAHADALIFDMRQNGGGSPEMIRFLTSYLFDSPTHLNSMIDRNGNVVEEYWTLEDVPGKRFANDLPVFVLTSNYTFSGAEEFSYNLKNLKRGVIVGETTGGGAHPVRGERISDRIVVMVPFMRANNPISKTNWEGTGVEPDVKCKAADALDVATRLAKEAIERRLAARD